MLFHHPDTSFKRLKSFYRRCNAFAKEGSPAKDHALSALYFNTLMAIESFDYLDRLVALDYFALRLEEYSLYHILKDDPDVSAMLYRLRQLIPVNPLMIV